MKVYLTYGTEDFLSHLKATIQATSLLLENGEDALLLVESDEGNPFQSGYTYEVLNAKGIVTNGTFAVLNHIQVTDEGKSLFEERFSKRAGLVEQEPGFAAIRVLRPQETHPYIVLTLWQSEQAFLDWQTSSAYSEAHKNRGTDKGLPQQLFSGPSYVKQFHVKSN
ncbi:putative enzyme involved in biosynthesis of extracellular polysaccharides [Fictibacillus macauensis ZFHKF-1]|uniref:Putative enzyme involved in biosynthesis of extracellular polysaccharides n=1 Tax=Fictibacillus macauensis ZFHKF-1 TaxID=1196324 RepID=I8AJW9_9BACL|nr:antibiotic biosynthesis monooxygenase [Fictibacillus macauensis]EIT85839.1 putative enzyme involved in biosynthesis of extracellular polysaccharides [Fictibacillus macauensis ZFHKF-1]